MPIKVLIKALFASLLFVGQAYSQDKLKPTVQAQVSAQSFYMGQAFSYTILIDGSNKVKPPLINHIPGFALKKTEERPLKSIEKPGFVIRYDLIPLQKGTLTIPEISIDVNGKEYLTQVIKIDAKQPKAHPGLKLSVLVSQNEVYVGEPFLLTFVWESEIPLYTLKAVDVKLPIFRNPAFRSILPFNAASGGSKDTIGLPVSDVRMICSHEILVKGDRRFEILKFKNVVIARYAGEFEIDPATLLCSFIPPSPKEMNFQRSKNWKPNYPSYFNNDFFEKTGDVLYEKYIANSNGLKIKVKDLPVDGKPDDFYGIVGKCEVSATADAVIIEAGAPLHLSVKISGYDFPSTLKMPNFSKLSTFNRNFSIPQQKSNGEYEGADKIYTQTLRPLRTDVSTIPPVRIPYFDPQTGTYNVAQSKEIPITVKPAGKVTAFDAELSSEANLKNRLLNSPQGIRHNKLDINIMSKASTKPLTLILWSLLVPTLLYVVFYISTADHRMKIADPNKYTSKKAYSAFSKKPATDIKALESNVRNYFADKLCIVADAHTIQEVLVSIKEKTDLSKEDIATLKNLYGSFTLNRFTNEGLNTDLSTLKASAEELIKSLDRRISHV
ncbi:MAG: BatD family protein [Lentisphaeraceae bacterium]|nr:BatD family protein [Lentisphaeraceae bacterium]